MTENTTKKLNKFDIFLISYYGFVILFIILLIWKYKYKSANSLALWEFRNIPKESFYVSPPYNFITPDRYYNDKQKFAHLNLPPMDKVSCNHKLPREKTRRDKSIPLPYNHIQVFD